MTANPGTANAQVGDILEARGLHGEPARCGQITQVIGEPGHRRYQVRWEDGHESIVFPADGVTVHHPGDPPYPGGR